MTTTSFDIPTLTTERLVLRAPRLDDFDLYARTLGSARMVHVDRLDRRDAWFVFCNEVGWYLVCAFLFSRPGPRAAYLRAKTAADRAFGTFLGLLGLKIALT